MESIIAVAALTLLLQLSLVLAVKYFISEEEKSSPPTTHTHTHINVDHRGRVLLLAWALLVNPEPLFREMYRNRFDVGKPSHEGSSRDLCRQSRILWLKTILLSLSMSNTPQLTRMQQTFPLDLKWIKKNPKWTNQDSECAALLLPLSTFTWMTFYLVENVETWNFFLLIVASVPPC